MNPRYDFFIAYTTADRERAIAIHTALTARGYLVFLDVKGIDPGAAWPTAIGEALGRSTVVLVLLSHHSVGHFAGEEAQTALAAHRQDPVGRQVVPIFLAEGVKAAYGFATFQALWATAGTDLLMKELVDWATTKRVFERRHARFRIAVVGTDGDEVGVRIGVVAALRKLTGVDVVEDVDPRSDLTIVIAGKRLPPKNTGGFTFVPKQIEMKGVPATEILDLFSLHNTVPDEQKYTTPDDAIHRVRDTVTRWIEAHLPPPETPAATALLHPWEQAWLRHLASTCERIQLGPLALMSRDGQRLDRARLYVSLKAGPGPWFVQEDGTVLLEEPAAVKRKGSQSAQPEREQRPSPTLEQLISHAKLPRIVVEGEAGSGKSILLQHAAHVLACASLGEPPPPHQFDLDALTKGAPRLRLPVLLDASLLIRECDGPLKGGVGALVAAMEAAIRSAVPDAPPALDLLPGLRLGRYLLLLDALDEVPGRDARERVLSILKSAAEQVPTLRYVLTTRPSPYTGVRLPVGVPVAPVAELDDGLVDELVAHWSAVQDYDAATAADLRAAVAEAGSRGDQGVPFDRNPLLLTAAMMVYGKERRLPNDLAGLYSALLTLLCQLRPRDGITKEMRLAALQVLCYTIQTAPAPMGGEAGTELPVDRAANVLLTWRAETVGRTLERAREFLDDLALDTGVLRFQDRIIGGKPVTMLRPWHRSFQEYLTAVHLTADARAVEVVADQLLASRAGGLPLLLEPGWERVCRFLVGAFGAGGDQRARALVSRLYGRKDQVPRERVGRLLGLVAAGITEYPQHFEGFDGTEGVKADLLAAFEADSVYWPMEDRLLAMEALGQLGDPRLTLPVAGRPPEQDPFWVEVAAGVYPVGGDEDNWSLPAERANLGRFFVSWRPVTVSDYAQFIRAGGFLRWRGEGPVEGEWGAPRDWHRQLLHLNRPVTGVSWFEARAFCRWASEVWPLPPGHVVDLPIERQWEAAARGPAGDLYPWGAAHLDDDDHEHVNFAMHVGHPSPVGAFPAGNRGRHADLAGNVWEWCRDLYDGVPVSDPSGSSRGSARVLRGGSYWEDAGSCRSACRELFHPDDRNGGIGFRVVLGPRAPSGS